MGTTLKLDVDEHTEINEVSLKSGGLTTEVEPGFCDIDEYDLTIYETVGTGVQTFDHVVDYEDGMNFVVIGLHKQSYRANDKTPASFTFDGVPVTDYGHYEQFYFTSGGSTGIQGKALSTDRPAGTYTVSIDPGDWPSGTRIGVFTGHAIGFKPAILDSYLMGDNNAASSPIWENVDSGNQPSIVVGCHLNYGIKDGNRDGAVSPWENPHPYNGPSPADFGFGLVHEGWGFPADETYPISGVRDVNLGFSGVAKRRCVLLIADNAAAQYPTTDIKISEPVVASANSDSITVTVE